MNGCKLDKSKPYGEVMGAIDGSRYTQDNKVFDALGTEVHHMSTGSHAQIEKKKLGRPPKEQ